MHDCCYLLCISTLCFGCVYYRFEYKKRLPVYCLIQAFTVNNIIALKRKPGILTQNLSPPYGYQMLKLLVIRQKFTVRHKAMFAHFLFPYQVEPFHGRQVKRYQLPFIVNTLGEFFAYNEFSCLFKQLLAFGPGYVRSGSLAEHKFQLGIERDSGMFTYIILFK